MADDKVRVTERLQARSTVAAIEIAMFQLDFQPPHDARWAEIQRHLRNLRQEYLLRAQLSAAT